MLNSIRLGGATFFRTTFFRTTLVRTTFVRIDLSSKRRKFESTLVRTVIKTDFSSNIIKKRHYFEKGILSLFRLGQVSIATKRKKERKKE